MNGQKKNKRLILGLMGLIALLTLMGLVYRFAVPKPQTGSKQVTFEVIVDGKTEKSYSISTDEEFLRKALESTEGLTISGDESQYGLFVKEINGRTADDSKKRVVGFHQGRCHA